MKPKAGFNFSLNVQVTFWLLTLLVISFSNITLLETPNAVIRILLLMLCHAALFYAFYSWLVPYWFIQKKYINLIVLAIIVFVSITFLRLLVENNFAVSLPPNALFKKLPGRFAIILFAEVLIASFASLLRLSVNNYEVQQKLSILQKEHLETELLFLKSQLNPHFLFNTINNLYALALEKSEKTPQALLKLSELLRYYLYECNQQTVSLQKEWKALQAFKELFELKYEQPLNITMALSTGNNIQIEPMILVPLMENCFKHSNIGKDKDAFINLQISNSNQQLYIVFANSYNAAQQQQHDEPGGIGISSVQKRLELNYAGKHEFLIEKGNFIYSTRLLLSLV